MTFRTALLGCLALLAPLAMANRAEATTIYTFAGLSTSPTTTTANATATPFGFDDISICTSSTGSPAPSCGGFGSTTGSFTVAPLAGFVLNVTGFSFDERNSGGLGPTSFDVFTSADGFASPIISGALGAGAQSFTHHSTALALLNLSSPLQVRIVSTGAPAAGPVSAWMLDNVTLTAEAVPAAAPEPAAALLLLTGMAAALRRRRA